MSGSMPGARALAFVCLGVAAALPAAAQTAPVVTAADYTRAEHMLMPYAAPLVDHAVSGVDWLDDGSVWYVEHDAAGDHYLRYDIAAGKAAPMFDQDKLAAALGKASGKPAKADALKLQDYHAEDGGRFRVTASGTQYTCDLSGRAGTCKAIADADPPAVRSPDGKREAFIRDWNLWLRDVASGKETQLTTDGVRDFGYATDNAGWTHSDKPILVWSPDSKKIATFQQDQRKASTMTLVDTGSGAPKVEQWKYPFAGDKDVILIERVIIDVGGSAPNVVRLRMPPDHHRSTCSDDLACNDGWEDVQWAADGSSLAFVSTDRGHKSATLRVADAATGAVRDVHTETVDTQYQSAPALSSVAWRYLPASNEFVWFSQESNWGHLYLYDLATGKLKRQLTRGDWNVTDIARIDPATRTLWFDGVGREAGDPYYVHYYKVGLDGGDPGSGPGQAVQLLTPEEATHVVTPSGDGRHFVDVYSTESTAPVAVLRDGDGRQVAELARADLSRLKAAGWVAPERFTVKARDGRTDLYGLMFKPSNFDAAKKYPIVTYIYPGPQVGSVGRRGFAPARNDNQALAELGFIVIAVDGTCTPLRSKAFQDACYGNMADNTLPDQVAALKQLAAKYPWIDATRAGIWGHSGGGNATAAAMFRYPDTYKVGIAESGNHDNLTYEDDWGERYQGLKVDRKDGSSNYSGQDNAPLAKHLKGKLFLLHGLMDDNVPPQNTLQLVDALVKANKDFDLLLLPHAHHGYGADSYYVMRRRWDYFVRNLMGATPPREFELKPPAP